MAERTVQNEGEAGKVDLFDIFDINFSLAAPISYETFAKIDWTPNDYLTYLALCDEVRSATITARTISFSGRKIQLDNKSKFADNIVEICMAKLFDWLQQFSMKTLPKPIGAASWCSAYINYSSPLVWARKKEPNPGLLYTSFHHFRAHIEGFISNTLHDRPLMDFSWLDFDIEKLSKREIEKRINQINVALKYIPYEDIDNQMDNYYKLCKWARDESRRNELEEELWEYKKRLQEITPIPFVQERTVLYIYTPGNIICIRNHHKMVDINCEIDTVDGMATINAQYCFDCEKYIISEQSYKVQMDSMGYLPVKLRYVLPDGSFPSDFNDDERLSEKSPLMLAGYSVNRKKGLTEADRRKRLVFLIQRGVLQKYEVIQYLEYFLRRNGRKAESDIAVQKWISDLEFILEYDMENQDTIQIDEITEY